MERKVVPSIGREAVCTTLEKTTSSRGSGSNGPSPTSDGDFVCAMEDVLEVYQRPHDPKRPVICFDEQSKQLIWETRTPLPARPVHPERVDYEYERNGTANLFITFEPLAGRRQVKVTDRRTKIGFAQVIRELV